MEAYHRDIRNLNGYKWPHGMIWTKDWWEQKNIMIGSIILGGPSSICFLWCRPSSRRAKSKFSCVILHNWVIFGASLATFRNIWGTIEAICGTFRTIWDNFWQSRAILGAICGTIGVIWCLFGQFGALLGQFGHFWFYLRQFQDIFGEIWSTGLNAFTYTGLIDFVYTDLNAFIYTGMKDFVCTGLNLLTYTGLNIIVYLYICLISRPEDELFLHTFLVRTSRFDYFPINRTYV